MGGKLRIILSICCFLIGLTLNTGQLSAQNIPVGSVLEEQYRIQQLLQDTLHHSFTHRGVSFDAYNDLMNRSTGSYWWSQSMMSKEEYLGQGIYTGVYHPTVKSTSNSMLPLGGNNGVAWYGRGITNELQGGFYLRHDHFSLSFRPHIAYQENASFRNPRFILRNENDRIRYVAEGTATLAERIDTPFRFGPDPFKSTSLGHSSLRINYAGFETGISSEPMWWGPAIRYPLVLSNNAPGFNHFFIGTRTPFGIHPLVGRLEFQWIMGRLEDSEWFDQEEYQKRRFINGINISYAPAFIPNLFIGITRINQQYAPNGVGFDDILTIFNPFERERFSDIPQKIEDEATLRSQISSFYFRWLMPSGKSEIYGEIYSEDPSENFRDFLNDPLYNSGYMFGFQTLFQRKVFDMVRVNMEITNMMPGRSTRVREQTYFYSNDIIRQGHTHKGQLLGAAIGPGSSSQFLAVDGFYNQFMGGIYMQRMVINDHLHYELSRNWRPNMFFGDPINHKINFSLGTRLQWQTGSVILGGGYEWTKAYNWGREGAEGAVVTWASRGRFDLYNRQLQVSLTYLF